MNRLGITNRLAKLGLRNAAEAYREEVRQRHRAAGKPRDEALVAAWEEMWSEFKPVVEQIEAAAAEPIPDPPAPQLQGLPADIDPLLDPDYSEPDVGKQLRDGLLWAAMEFQRVIRDTADGPVASIGDASTPPPSPFALFTLATYALSGIDKRRDLIGRALSFATRSHDNAQEAEPGDDAGGFLDGM